MQLLSLSTSAEFYYKPSPQGKVAAAIIEQTRLTDEGRKTGEVKKMNNVIKQRTDPVFLRMEQLMKEQGITGRELSEKLGLVPSACSQWKNDSKRRSYMLYIDEISRILGTTPTYLLRGTGETSLSPQETEFVKMLRKVDKKRLDYVKEILRLFVEEEAD